tara:strand:+ start:2409 stop:2852 length:444 start_codon:yes stop_codon:yes gene_type:complete
MALSADHIYETADTMVQAFQVTNASVIFAGSLVGVDNTTGLALAWTDVAAEQFVGFAMNGVTGDTTADEPPEVHVNTGGTVLKKVAVTGVTAITDVGNVVYATDDNTFDLSVGTNPNPVGLLTRYYTGTTCDVRLFGLGEWQGVELP